MKHDPRWCDSELLETKPDGSEVIFMKAAKPVIPIVSRRQMICQITSLRNYGGEGRHLNIATSVEHPSKPIPSGMMAEVRATLECVGILCEKNPNGAGTRLTEIKCIDLGGSIPGKVISAATDKQGKAMYEIFTILVEKRQKGEI